MTMRKCRNCKHYSRGVTDEQRHKWEWSNLGRWADGVCDLYFPRGYIARKPPHPVMGVGSCFQFEERYDEQISIEMEDKK